MRSTASVPLLVAALTLVAVPAVAAEEAPAADEVPASGVNDIDLPASEMSLTDARVVNVGDGMIISMSPDGRRIAVAREMSDPATSELCVLELGSLEDVACASLAELQAGLRMDDVSWSPDSRYLAFTERAFEVFVDGDLWLMDASSGQLTNLLDDSFEGPLPLMQREPEAGTITIPSSPAFTPEGTALSFSRSLLVDGAMAGNDVVTLSLDRGEPEQLWLVDPMSVGVAYMGMGWAPNGEQLYLSVSDPGGRADGDGIWVVDTDGGDARQLVRRQQRGGSPPAVLQVAPDGKHLLAYDPALYGGTADGEPPLWLVDTRTGTATPLLTSSAADTRTRPASWAGFSPNGALVTLLATTDAGALAVRDVQGTEEHLLSLAPELTRLAATGPADHRSAGTWSSDGRLLLALAGDPSSALLLEFGRSD